MNCDVCGSEEVEVVTNPTDFTKRMGAFCRKHEPKGPGVKELSFDDVFGATEAS